MQAQTFYFFEEMLDSLPLKLLRMVDVRRDCVQETMPIAREVIDGYMCDSDPEVCGKLRVMYPTAEALANCPEFRAVLQQWGRTGKLCNMQTERMLKAIKTATPDKCPHLDRMLSAGLLTQWLTRHVREYNGDDPRVTTRAQLLEAGAPLKAGVKQQRAENGTQGGMQPWMAYANSRRSNAATAGAQVQSQKIYADAFNHLPLEAQLPWRAVASEARSSKRKWLEECQDKKDSRAKFCDDFKQRGLGISDVSQPLAAHVAKHIVDRDFPVRANGRPRGASVHWSSYRTKFTNGKYVNDEGELYSM